MGLFQKSVLKKYLDELDDKVVRNAYGRFKAFFFDKETQENISQSKEEQFQEGFLRELFVNVLGYTISPNPDYNLSTEFKNQTGAKKADGAILLDGKALGVIELKSTKTKDLESVRQQAFDYKANHAGCVYVITSNFEKLRFYIKNAVDYEEFHLFSDSQLELFNTSFERFKLLYLCLSKDSIFNNIPLKIKDASLLEEEAITKKFYGDYSLFKRELYRDMVKQNMQNAELRELAETSIKKTLFKKSQKLLDRFLFIFFAEDRGLLPPNAISKVLEEWEKLRDLDAYRPLYQRYKKHFDYLDKGYKGKEYEIFAYNGGLFEPDAILDSLSIDDDLLFRHTSKLTKYNFETDVDVNILGHIFEHSLNEIESVNAEIEGAQFDKQKTKRKKDGIFYTPKYITKYIVDNTIGRLCEEKRKEHGIVEEEYLKSRKGRKKDTIKALDEKLKAYRKWLLEITICDPACGSGAFLNQALDYLICEHRCIDELNAKLYGDSLVFPNVEKHILENNIYGVDLNEESIEIAKLSLWLRTAQKGRKLTTLSSNIKCGNSLIDDPAVAGDKAFRWEDEFSEVFEKGGFDVVIGNPPYGAELDERQIKHIETSYLSFEYQVNSYVIFYEKGITILKSSGLLGFITPATFTYQHYFKNIRKIFAKYKLISVAKYFYEVFQDADIGDSISWIIEKTENKKANIAVYKSLNKQQALTPKLLHINYKDLLNDDGTYDLSSSLISVKRFESNSKKLGDLCQIIVGIKAYQKGKGVPKQTREIVKDKIFTSTSKKDETYINCVIGKDFHRYKFLKESEMYLSYGKWLAEPRSGAPFFDDEKIVLRQTSDSLIGTIDAQKRINLNNVYNVGRPKGNIDLHFILCLLNSSLLNLLYQSIAQEKGRLFAEVKKINLAKLPIIIPSSEVQNKFAILAKDIISTNTELTKLLNSLTKYIQQSTSLIEIPSKLQNWHQLDFGEFIKELNKAIKKAGGEKLSKKDEIEWMELFEDYKEQAVELQSEIDKTDKEIDRMVYDLYELTEEEIALVEG